MAVRQAKEAAMRSREVARIMSRFPKFTVSKISASRLRASLNGNSTGTDLIATVRPDKRISPKP